MVYLAIFIGGGLGSISRFLISSLVSGKVNGNFPWHTLSVNLIGAFLIGMIVEIFALKYSASENIRYLLVTGFLGGFTTFSAFSLESALMFNKGEYLFLSGYILASVLGTIAMVLMAIYLIRNFVGSP